MKEISDVQIKRIMKYVNESREWSNGTVEELRNTIIALTHYLLQDIERRMVGSARVGSKDITNAYNFCANAILDKTVKQEGEENHV